MNEEQSDRAFRSAFDELQRCFQQGSGNNELLGGEVSFLVRVDQAGTGEASLERSSLGDRETERCMLDALESRAWPKPVGGRVGEARKPFVFDPPEDVRPPVAWSADDVTEALAELEGAIAGCKSTSGGTFEATVYVGTDGGPLSVGMSAPAGSPDRAADCLVDVLSDAQFPSPGSWPAKVRFVL